MSIIISNDFKIVKIIKPSNAVMFKDLAEGDTISIVCPVSNSYNSARLTVRNLKSGAEVEKTHTELSNILMKFELEPVNTSASAQISFEEPKDLKEATHQRDLLLEVVWKILVKAGMLTHSSSPNGAETYMHALDYLKELK